MLNLPLSAIFKSFNLPLSAIFRTPFLPKFTIFISPKVPKFAFFKAYYTKQHNYNSGFCIANNSF